MELDLHLEKEGALNDTGQSTADGAQTPQGQLSAVEKDVINDQYGLKPDTISSDGSQEESVRSMSPFHREENVPDPKEDTSRGENSENTSPVSDEEDQDDILITADGVGDAFQDSKINVDVNTIVGSDNKNIGHDEDMDPLITVDDTESQSSDLINFDTVSYDVIQHPEAEDDDEKSIATISSLSCDIKMDSPSKHSQGSNSSSLINLLDKEASVVPGSPSFPIVEVLSSRESSCPSSPFHLSSIIMSSTVQDSGSDTPVNCEDKCMVSNENHFGIVSKILPCQDAESFEWESRGCRASPDCQQDKIKSSGQEPFSNSSNNIGKDECNPDDKSSENVICSQEITPADSLGVDEICKNEALLNNAINDHSNNPDERGIILSPSSETPTEETIFSDSTTFEPSVTDLMTTTLAGQANSLSSDVLNLQESHNPPTTFVTTNEISCQIIASESAQMISSDIPAKALLEDEVNTVISLNDRNVLIEEVSLLSPSENISSSEDKGNKEECVSVTPVTQSDHHQSGDNFENSENLKSDKNHVLLSGEATLVTPVHCKFNEELGTDVLLGNVKTIIETKEGTEHNALLIETESSSESVLDLCSKTEETIIKDFNLQSRVSETCLSSESFEIVHQDLLSSSVQIKRPTSLPNIHSSYIQPKHSHSMILTDFIGCVQEANVCHANDKGSSASVREDAQRVASSLVDDILGSAILKAEETLISSAICTSNRVEAVEAANMLVDEILSVAVAQVSCDDKCEKLGLENSHVKGNLTKPLMMSESVLKTTDRTLSSPSLDKHLLVEERVNQSILPLSQGVVQSPGVDLSSGNDHNTNSSLSESPFEELLSISNNNATDNIPEEEEGETFHNVLVDKSVSSEIRTISPPSGDTASEPEDERNSLVSKPFKEEGTVNEVNTVSNLKISDIGNAPEKNIESNNYADGSPAENMVEVCSNGCTPEALEHIGDDGQIATDLACKEVLLSLNITSSEVDLESNGKNSSGEISLNNSITDVKVKEETDQTSSSEVDASDSPRSSLLTCSDLGLRSEASIFVDGVLEEAVKMYHESSSSESSPVKLKSLVFDSDFLQEEEELSTPCGEMLTEHFMDFESGRNVSVFCSIPDNPSDDHLLTYDRIAHTIGNREVDSDTGKSVSVFRIEDDVYYEIQRASTCTSVFESVEEEDEDMIDTTVPVEERPNRTMKTSASFPSFERDKLDFSDDPLKADSDAFEDAVGAFLAKEKLARDERKFLTKKNTKDIGVSNSNSEENTCRALVLRHPEYDLSNQEEKKRMAEKWANGGELEVPDTPEMREKQRLIREALESDENVAVKLCKLALTEGGLINDTLRREAWPRMLGLDPTLEVDAPSLDDLKSHPEYGQVVLDVNRSLKRFPPDIPKDQRETLQDKLTRLIMYVISKHPHLRYYQGYHDVAVTFLLVVGESVAFQIMERLSTEHLSDCMQPTMERTSYLLHFIYPLLHRLHPTLADYLERSEVGTMFCLPWFLTWFGHSLDRYQDVVRLYDHFLASPPLAPLYVAAVLVAHRADEVLAVDCDMAAIHALLSHIPETLPLEILLRDATDLYIKFPPESIEREVEERFRNEQEIRVHEMEARERVRQRALRRRRGHSHGSWQIAEVNNRIGGTMMTLNRWMPPWVVQQQRLSMRLLFASATFFVGFYVYSRGGDMLPYM